MPADRMKTKKKHRIPLSTRATEMLKDMHLLAKDGGYVLSGQRENRPLSNTALLAVIKRMNEDETVWMDADKNSVVPHDFRSTFRD